MPRVLEEEERFELLAKVAKEYPDQVNSKDLGIEDEGILRATLSHLEENRYVRVSWAEDLEGKHPMAVAATARGYDYCERAGLFDDDE